MPNNNTYLKPNNIGNNQNMTKSNKKLLDAYLILILPLDLTYYQREIIVTYFNHWIGDKFNSDSFYDHMDNFIAKWKADLIKYIETRSLKKKRIRLYNKNRSENYQRQYTRDDIIDRILKFSEDIVEHLYNLYKKRGHISDTVNADIDIVIYHLYEDRRFDIETGHKYNSNKLRGEYNHDMINKLKKDKISAEMNSIKKWRSNLLNAIFLHLHALVNMYLQKDSNIKRIYDKHKSNIKQNVNDFLFHLSIHWINKLLGEIEKSSDKNDDYIEQFIKLNYFGNYRRFSVVDQIPRKMNKYYEDTYIKIQHKINLLIDDRIYELLIDVVYNDLLDQLAQNGWSRYPSRKYAEVVFIQGISKIIEENNPNDNDFLATYRSLIRRIDTGALIKNIAMMEQMMYEQSENMNKRLDNRLISEKIKQNKMKEKKTAKMKQENHDTSLKKPKPSELVVTIDPETGEEVWGFGGGGKKKKTKKNKKKSKKRTKKNIKK